MYEMTESTENLLDPRKIPVSSTLIKTIIILLYRATVHAFLSVT